MKKADNLEQLLELINTPKHEGMGYGIILDNANLDSFRKNKTDFEYGGVYVKMEELFNNIIDKPMKLEDLKTLLLKQMEVYVDEAISKVQHKEANFQFNNFRFFNENKNINMTFISENEVFVREETDEEVCERLVEEVSNHYKPYFESLSNMSDFYRILKTNQYPDDQIYEMVHNFILKKPQEQHSFLFERFNLKKFNILF